LAQQFAPDEAGGAGDEDLHARGNVARRRDLASATKRTCQAKAEIFTCSNSILMSKPSPSGTGANATKPDPESERWVKAFRAFLHTAITAEGLGNARERLATLPGPQMPDFCIALAKLPDNTLASELVRPVYAVLRQIEETVGRFRPPQEGEPPDDPETAARWKRIQEQLDFALALIFRHARPVARHRAESTSCADLLVDAMFDALGDAGDAARLIRRYQALFPEDDRAEDGSVLPDSGPELFAWDAYQRVGKLDELADEFPEHIRNAARNMHAWPMLVHRHTNNRRRFRELAARLELGADYPLDASEDARCRPDTPIMRYLDPLVASLENLRSDLAGANFASTEEENKGIDRLWRDWPSERTSEEVLKILRVVQRLPPLTKTTANEWAEMALVPLILITDARDPAKCEKPVLQRIWNQKGVKSRATFKSRLLAAVSATLRRLARNP